MLAVHHAHRYTVLHTQGKESATPDLLILLLLLTRQPHIKWFVTQWHNYACKDKEKKNKKKTKSHKAKDFPPSIIWSCEALK